MAQADSVPTPIQAPITGATSNASTNCHRSVDSAIEQPQGPKMATGYHVVVLGYATTVLLLGWFPWNALLILLLLLCRSDRGGAL
jgi:hypothetical protein